MTIKRRRSDSKPLRTDVRHHLPWTPQDLVDISNYVNEGGTVLLSSMEVLSRLEGSTNFSRGVLQVQSFLTDENGSMGAQQISPTPS